MTIQHHIEIYSAGCSLCKSTIELVNRIACSGAHIQVLDMHDQAIAQQANKLGIKRLPAVVIDGRLADCCQQSSVNEHDIRQALSK